MYLFVCVCVCILCVCVSVCICMFVFVPNCSSIEYCFHTKCECMNLWVPFKAVQKQETYVKTLFLYRTLTSISDEGIHLLCILRQNCFVCCLRQYSRLQEKSLVIYRYVGGLLNLNFPGVCMSLNIHRTCEIYYGKAFGTQNRFSPAFIVTEEQFLITFL